MAAPLSTLVPSVEEAVSAIAHHFSSSSSGSAGTGHESIVLPVFTELIADLETPVSAYLKLKDLSLRPGATPLASVPLGRLAVLGDSQSSASSAPSSASAPPSYSFLLESVEGGERLGRYSIVGFSPRDVLVVNPAASASCSASSTSSALSGDPLSHVEAYLKKDALVTPPSTRGHLPAFCGGVVGYVGYDAVRHFEPTTAPLLDKQQDTLGVPEAVFLCVDDCVLFDHVRHTIKVLAHLRVPIEKASDAASVAEAYHQARGRIETIITALNGPIPAAAHQPHAPPATISPSSSSSTSTNSALLLPPLHLTSNTGQAGYESAVLALKDHIKLGNIIQAVPSHRCYRELPSAVDAFTIYRHLRIVNPSPYLFCLSLGSPALQIVGASPECLVKVTEDGTVYTHPIAGTRRRGATPEEDAALSKELLADEKERSEHVMLVDLGRNDLGRIAAPGTVVVEKLMAIEKYSHVLHLVSTVKAKLDTAKGRTAMDAFRSVHPAGTLSGAPKVRAVQLVAELEKEKRGIYGGACGYWSFGLKSMDTAIAIRTLVVREEEGRRFAFLQAGAGIVHDSVPTSEWEETMAKMRGVDRAIQSAFTAAGAGAAATGGAEGR